MLQYPSELKEKVVSEYVKGECGYKLLARKYGLTRDTVRHWVLSAKLPIIILPMADNKNKNREALTQELEYYKASSEYWKAYAEKLEEKRFGISQKKNKGRSNNRTSSDKKDSHS